MAHATVIPHPRAWRGRAALLRREREKPHRQRLEARIWAALEKLENLRDEYIARLDALQGDCDLEEGSDLEPNCGYTGNPGWDEAEPADDDFEPDLDHEPSLGAPEGAQDYSRARCGTNDERELACDDEGDNSDRDESH